MWKSRLKSILQVDMPRFVSRVVELSFAEGPENSDEKMGCKRPKLTPLVDNDGSSV